MVKIILIIFTLYFYSFADVIAPGIHVISQSATIDNLDTAKNAVFIPLIYSCNYVGCGCHSCNDTLKPGEFFPLVGPGRYSVTNLINIYPSSGAVFSWSLLPDTAWVLDANPTIRQEYHYRIYYDWQGNMNLSMVKKISFYNNSIPDDTLIFPLPNAVEQAKAKEQPSLRLTCSATTISYTLSKPQSATIRITNVKGQIVGKMATSGGLSGNLPFPNLPAGAYFVELRATEGSATERVTVLK